METPKKFITITDDAADERLEYRPEGLDAIIYYRRLSREAMDEINRRHQKIDMRRGRTPYIPDDKRVEVNKDIWDHIILGWDGVVGVDGQPVPCTRDIKYKLPGRTMTELLELADSEELGRTSPNS
jgi:hypothetical protein